MKSRLAVLALALILAGGIALDAISPAKLAVSKGSVVPATAGVYACPYAMQARGVGFVHLANFGASAATTRITILPKKGAAVIVPVALRAGAATTFRIGEHIAAKRLPAGIVVEYTGDGVVASHTLWLPRNPGPVGGGASTCARTGGSRTAIPHLRTLGAESHVAVLNPGSADASVTITLVADGHRIAPVHLSRLTIPALGRREFRVGDYAFNAHEVTAIITATVGSVVSEGLIESTSGVALLGAEAPSIDVVAIAGRTGPGATLGLTAISEDNAALEARLLSSNQQARAVGVPQTLDPAAAKRIAIPSRDAGGVAAYRFSVDAGSPIVAGAGWSIRRPVGADEAAAEGMSPARHWGGVIGSVIKPAATAVILVNSGPGTATVHLRLLTETGESGTDLTIGAGRVAARAIGSGIGTFAVEAVSDVPIAVAIQQYAVSSAIFGFATPATPFLEPTPTDVIQDPRAAIPASAPPR